MEDVKKNGSMLYLSNRPFNASRQIKRHQEHIVKSSMLIQNGSLSSIFVPGIQSTAFVMNINRNGARPRQSPTPHIYIADWYLIANECTVMPVAVVAPRFAGYSSCHRIKLVIQCNEYRVQTVRLYVPNRH
jgi:hypothetical protein